MSPTGRFVVCIDCHLSVEFPDGARYDVIARQFASHLCGRPRPSEDHALSAKIITVDARTSEALNRFDFDHNASPMWVFDINTLAFSAVNDATVSHYGYSRKEFLSMTILDILLSEDIASVLQEILQKRVLNTIRELRKHKKKDGTLIDVEITRSEVLFNGRIADLVTAINVPLSVPPGASSP